MQTALSRGLVAVIDPEDYPLVAAFKWHAREDRSSGVPRFYAHTNIPAADGRPRTKLLLHRLVTNARPGEKIDHRSGDGLDCRKSNLRRSTDSQNQANRGSYTGTSAFKGVSWVRAKQKWRAAIHCDGRTRFLGYFETERLAAEAYDKAAAATHGEFARLNFPTGQGVTGAL